MFRIKRVKGGRAAWATAVEPRGNVAGWSADPTAAVPVTAGVAERVTAFHAHRPLAGELTCEPVTVEPGRLADVVTDQAGIDAAEFKRFQAECRRLAEGCDAAAARADAAEALAAEKAARLAAAERTIAKQGEELTVQAARVAEAEQLLAAATEPGETTPTTDPAAPKRRK